MAKTAPPPPPEWTYNRQQAIYRKGNRGITPLAVVNARNAAITASMPGADALTARMVTGAITLQDWQAGMREQIKTLYLQQYMLGRGGLDAMTQADYGRVGGMLTEQYRYLDNFAREIAQGKLSPAQIAMRARMYLDSSTQAYERGKAAARGLRLPAYPGDGGTRCRTKCKCRWDIRNTEAGYVCYWRLGHAEHCEDCVRNAAMWNPLVIPV